MLILSRHVDESIIIDDDVKVTVIGISRKQVRIGIEAPKDISVHRKEIWLRIQDQQNKKADKEES